VRFQKTARSAVFFAASAAILLCENVTLVAHRIRHFRFFLAIIVVSQFPPTRGVLVHQNSLASCQPCRHSVEPRAPIFWVLGGYVTCVDTSRFYWTVLELPWSCAICISRNWFDKGFVIWHFRNYCLVQNVSLRSFNIGVQIVFTNDVLVDSIKKFKWNTSLHD